MFSFSLDVVDTASELPLNIISRCSFAKMSVEELFEPDVRSPAGLAPRPIPVPKPADEDRGPRPDLAAFFETARGSKKAPEDVISILRPAYCGRESELVFSTGSGKEEKEHTFIFVFSFHRKF